jgi:glucokinase
MILSLDLGGTNIKIAVFDLEINLIEIFKTETNSHLGFDSVIDKITKLLLSYISKYEIKVIGIGFPSVVLENGYVFTAPNLIGCNNINVIDRLKENIKIPIYIDNDANVAAIAELELGNGINTNSFLYVTLGTGVGGAIIFDRKLFKGINCGAGEIGHLIIDKDDLTEYNLTYRKGILEEYLGRNQILRDAKKFYSERNHKFSNIDFDVVDISNDATKGDLTSIKFIEGIGEILGIGISSALNLLDIDKVIIGGGISQIHESFYIKLLETIQKRTLPSLSKSIEVYKAKFLNDAGIYGAAILAKKNY